MFQFKILNKNVPEILKSTYHFSSDRHLPKKMEQQYFYLLISILSSENLK
jgi:hypothetical protein